MENKEKDNIMNNIENVVSDLDLNNANERRYYYLFTEYKRLYELSNSKEIPVQESISRKANILKDIYSIFKEINKKSEGLNNIQLVRVLNNDIDFKLPEDIKETGFKIDYQVEEE